MNKLIKSLMSGASLAAIQIMGLAATGRAFAAGITVAATRGSLTVAGGHTADYIEVTSTGHVHGNVTNEGTVGVSETGIVVDNGGSVTGSIINAKNALIGATTAGIYIGGFTAEVGAVGNAGKILVVNDLSGSGSSAQATGIHWSNPGPHSVVTNSGAITANAAVKSSSRAYVSARGAVFGAGKSAGDGYDLVVTNSGKITVDALAKATSEVHAYAAGIEVGTSGHSLAGNSAAAAVHNTGSLSVRATAVATGKSAERVSATAMGVVLNVLGDVHDVDAKLTNSGSIGVHAQASGAASTVRATALGVDLYAAATGTNAAVAYLDNTGNIAVTAVVHGLGDVAATAQGAEVRAEGPSAAATVINAAGAKFDVSAKATGWEARATASGIGESADGDKAVAKVANSGTIDVKAVAVGVPASSVAHARAYADGIEQAIFGGKSVAEMNARVTNAAGAVVHVTASARATAPAGNASAKATARFAIDQFAYSEDVGATADLTLSNSGSIVLNADAAATAATAKAVAVLDSFGGRGVVGQQVFGFSGTASSALKADMSLKNAGKIYAAATAVAHGGLALATAKLDYGVNQSARSVIGASMQLSNAAHGKITDHLVASALSTGAGKATAHATAERAIGQAGQIFGTASHPGNAVEGITNSGSLKVSTLAHAQASRTAHARVEASRAMGIFQTLTGMHHNSGSGSSSATDNPLFDKFTQSITNTNSGTLSLTMKASASNLAKTGAGSVSAEVGMGSGIRQAAYISAQAGAKGTAVLSFSNAGKIAMNGAATAVALAGRAEAGANIDDAIQQNAVATQASENFSNSGVITLAVAAKAVGVSEAQAYGDIFAGVDQYEDAGAAVETLDNSGTIQVSESASAQAEGGAFADVSGIDPYVIAQRVRAEKYASPVMLTFTNDAGAALAATAQAMASGKTAQAYGRYTGAEQYAYGTNDAVLSLSNAGKINIQVAGTAVGAASAQASAYGEGLLQEVEENYVAPQTPYTGKLSATNSGTLSVAAKAAASGDVASAKATAAGVVQRGDYAAFTADFANLGSIAVAATAIAAGGAASASAIGLSIYGDGRVSRTSHLMPVSAKIDVTNSGTIKVTAAATGAAPQAVARGILAEATSVVQRTSGTKSGINVRDSETASAPVSGSVENDGTLSVQATASGGKSKAYGVELVNDIQTVTVTNKGSIDVTAAGATAVARAIYEHNWGGVSHTTYHYVSGHYASQKTSGAIDGPAFLISGAIQNDGTLNVGAKGTASAKADAIYLNAGNISAAITNTGKITAAATGAAAAANGIDVVAQLVNYVKTRTEHYDTGAGKYVTVTHKHTALTTVHGNSFSGKIENDGTITVSAKSNGGNAFAAGIDLNVDHDSGAIVNKGTITVTASGKTAVADDIVISDYPAPPMGNGSIVNQGGTLYASVSNAETTTRGNAIDLSAAPNPVTIGLNGGNIYGNIVESADGNAITVGAGNTLFDGLINPSKAKLGTLTIAAGGSLELAANPAEGPGGAYVDNYVQKGALVLDVTPGSNGKIFANSATLGGTAVLNPVPGGGAFGLQTTYRVVFSGSAINTTWDSVGVNGGVLLSAAAKYTTNEADVVLTRVPFDAVPDLTPNETSVGGALETIYDSNSASGPLDSLVLALFKLDKKDYSAALDSLSGEEVGEIEAGNMSAVDSFLDKIEDHIGAGSTLDTSSLEGATVTPAQSVSVEGGAWGGAFGSWSNTAATISGPGYTTHNSGLLAGYDREVLPNLILGVSAEYSNGTMKATQAPSWGSFNGFQVAAYGRYVFANGFYALGDASIGSYSDRSHRYISINGYGTGIASGKFSTNAYGLYGEAGYTYQAFSPFSLTPYVALRYLDGHSSAFTETGPLSVNLHVDAADSTTTSSFLGVNVATTLHTDQGQTFTPHVKVAWEHDFTNDGWIVNAGFAVAPGTNFAVNGSALAKESAVLGAGVTLNIEDGISAMLDYDGRYSSSQSENTIMGRVRIDF